MTDVHREGRHVGYLFTEEGKLFVKNLAFYAETERGALQEIFRDEPRGHQVTLERYRKLLRKKF